MHIIVNDFNFDHYATLSLLSFSYAIVQGVCFGAAAGFVVTWFVYMINGVTIFGNPVPLFQAIACLVAILAARLTIEGYTVLYRTAQDAGVYLRKQNQIKQ